MRAVRLIAVTLIFTFVALAQSAPQSSQTAAQTATAKPAPPANLPVIPAFDESAMDKAVSPCQDFFRYACGGWMARNPIPPDQSRWGRFDQLQERNRDILHDILERAAQPDPKRSPVTQKIGDMYASCMDEPKVNALGAKPVQPELDSIAGIASRRDLINAIGRLQSLGVGVLFRFGPQPDLHNASMMIAAADQGGLGLPDRDYYIKDDAKSVETREKYLAHVQKMFELVGGPAQAAAAEAKAVMNIETQLAKASMDRTARRDPTKLDHPMTREQFLQLAPGFEFQTFLASVAPPAFDKVNVGNPDFFKQINPLLDSISLNDWKTYLRWHVLRARAPWLSQPFVDENFNFYSKYLAGQQELQARWKRCVRLTDAALGEALGQPFVDETFGVEGKQRTLTMVQAIEQAMGEDLKTLSWMTAETKKQADVKLAAVTNKIGYPDKWRDYSRLSVDRGDLAGNVARADSFEFNRQINKISKPVDKKEWGMSPPTVNAYYNPSQNNINFPAGILQPPFYDNKIDDAVNFGGIGAVIGHELTHGFDDQGSRFDAKGDLSNWWTPTDDEEFKRRTGCIADEYGQFIAIEDVRLNGKLTLGENTADNGGVRLSLMALHRKMKAEAKPDQPINGFTPDQRFFISYGQIWCQNVSPAQARLRALTDPHSPGQYRVNGVVSNMPEFWQAFGCKQGQPMIRENACRVW